MQYISESPPSLLSDPHSHLYFPQTHSSVSLQKRTSHSGISSEDSITRNNKTRQKTLISGTGDNLVREKKISRVGKRVRNTPTFNVSSPTNPPPYKTITYRYVQRPSTDLCRLCDCHFNLCEPLWALLIDSMRHILLVSSTPLVSYNTSSPNCMWFPELRLEDFGSLTIYFWLWISASAVMGSLLDVNGLGADLWI